MGLQPDGNAALVTGSSGGIGAGMAEALVEEGAAVLVHGRERDGAERVASDLCGCGGQAGAMADAWLRSRPIRAVPIIGARSEEQLAENLGCLDIRLEPDQLDRLDEVSRIELGFPHDFLREDARPLLYGDLRDRIDA
jgi:NAD(P)-dependent dehydrogenase (short-subunit alcohol dehydrogenase family)